MPDQDPNCRNLADQTPAPSSLPALPKALYAELRSTTSGATIGVNLDGAGGVYSGEYAIGKCDAPESYTIERLVLVDAGNGPVATAVRNGASAYTVSYARGGSVLTTSFPSVSLTYNAAATAPTVSLQGISGVPAMAKLGDSITAQVAVSDPTCGVRDSRWWLASTPGTMVSTTAEISVLAGGSGTVNLRLPPRLAVPATYYLEGQVTLQSGRVFAVRRSAPTDNTYRLFDRSSPVGDPGPAVTPIAVVDNPDADRTPPRPSLLTASPPSANRCDQVSFELRMIDDKGLPQMQTVKLWLGTAEQSKLTSVQLTGADVLTGTLHLPADAPYGVWYGYPDSVRDFAGNVASGQPKPGQQFVVSDGMFTSLPIMEATFIVPNKSPLVLPDLGLASIDGGVPTVDMATPALPAQLSAVAVTPTAVAKEGDKFQVRVTWQDQSMPPILK
jgi:hypothetical protein